jgi:hypothetical protein
VLKRFQKQFGKLESKLNKPRIFWFSKPSNKDILNVFGKFIEDYLRNLTCWENSKNRFVISTPKLNKNR